MRVTSRFVLLVGFARAAEFEMSFLGTAAVVHFVLNKKRKLQRNWSSFLSFQQDSTCPAVLPPSSHGPVTSMVHSLAFLGPCLGSIFHPGLVGPPGTTDPVPSGISFAHLESFFSQGGEGGVLRVLRSTKRAPWMHCVGWNGFRGANRACWNATTWPE